MSVHRAPMRSRRDDVDPALAISRATSLGLVGMGEADDDRAERRVERFAALPVGSEVWTRDEDGLFLHGVVTGSYRRDDAPAAREADLVHVRACDWDAGWLQEHQVPAPVAATFRRGGRNFQRITAL